MSICLFRPGTARTRTEASGTETSGTEAAGTKATDACRQAEEAEEADRKRTVRRTVTLWLVATLATLGAVTTLSAVLLGHYLVIRADEEIQRFSGAPLPADITRFDHLDGCLILVVDAKGRVLERHTGARAMPDFPSLTPDRLRTYARQAQPVAFGSTYRAQVMRDSRPGPGHRGNYVIHARSMSDTISAVHRLIQVEASASLPMAGLVLLGARRVARRAARERAASERRLREFLAAAGHELRNPLTTISGYTELARTGGESYEPMRQKALGRVAAEVRRMDSLIDELVLLSRLDLGQPLRLDRVDLAQICRDAVETERQVHPGRRVRLLVAPGEHTVTGDPLRLHQVVANLLTNARVHTPEGTTTTLGLGAEDGHRVLEVTDDGPGIPDGLRPTIFDRFVRGEDTHATGSGLGLSIVAAIATAHGGSVTLEPSDRGAWFRVRLPAPT